MHLLCVEKSTDISVMMPTLSNMILRHLIFYNIALGLAYKRDEIYCNIDKSNKKLNLTIDLDVDDFEKDGINLHAIDLNAKLNLVQINVENTQCELRYTDGQCVQ